MKHTKEPKAKDFDLQPYGYINALQSYIKKQKKQKAELLKALKEISISLHFEVIRRIANKAIKNATL